MIPASVNAHIRKTRRSNAELEVLLLDYRAAPNARLRQQIMQGALGIAAAVVCSRFRRWWRHGDDLLSEACIGLDRAIDTWDPARGDFSTVAYQNAFSHCTRYLGHFRGGAVRGQLHHDAKAPAVVALDGMERWRADRTLGSVEQDHSVIEEHEAARELIASMPEPLAAMAFDLAFAGATFKTLAAREGISKQAMQMRHARMLRRWRAEREAA